MLVLKNKTEPPVTKWHRFTVFKREYNKLSVVFLEEADLAAEVEALGAMAGSSNGIAYGKFMS